jgi:hypothetical protein
MTSVNERMTREEIAALVCATLDNEGIRVALSGGSVVSIYSDNEYESYDLDFISLGLARNVAATMSVLGFVKQGRYWIHPNSRYWVEFPPGPVQVGDAIVNEFSERPTRFGVLRLLRPTECVMDRLAGYYHWKDPQGLEQALSVARRQPVDLKQIGEWSQREGAEAGFKEFLRRLEERG